MDRKSTLTYLLIVELPLRQRLDKYRHCVCDIGIPSALIMEAESDGEAQRGRYPDGRKRRWSRVQKSVAKRARIGEILAVARTWREPSNVSQRDETRRDVPTRNGVGKWIEALPWELREVVFE